MPHEVIKAQLLTRALNKSLPDFNQVSFDGSKQRGVFYPACVTTHSTLTLLYGMPFNVSYGSSDTTLISSSIPIWPGRGSINIIMFCLRGL